MQKKTLGASTDQGEAHTGNAADKAGAEKWPPHLLQATGFRPNQRPEDISHKSGGMVRFVRNVALVAVAVGIGWGVHTYWRGVPSGMQTAMSAQNRELQKLAREEKNTLTRVLSDLRILQSAFANLQGQVSNLPARSDLDRVKATVASLQKALKATGKTVAFARNEQSGAIAALAARIEAIEKSAKSTGEALAVRIEKLEKAASEKQVAAVSTVPEAAANTSKVARTASASARVSAKPPRKQGFGYVVRDVHRGIAIVEDRNGDFLEVYPGVTVPGAGRVRTIRRRGGQWEVVTSRGTIDSTPY